MRPYYEAKRGRRPGAARERPRAHDRAPGRAHRRPGNGARQGRHGPRARRDSARGRGRHAAGRAGDAQHASARRSSWSPAIRRSKRPSGACERGARRGGAAPRALGPRGPRHHLRRPGAGSAALRGRRPVRVHGRRTCPGSGSCGPMARLRRASASAACWWPRACRSAASGWTCARPGFRSAGLDDEHVAGGLVRDLVRHAPEHPPRTCMPTLPITITSAPCSLATARIASAAEPFGAAP